MLLSRPAAQAIERLKKAEQRTIPTLVRLRNRQWTLPRDAGKTGTGSSPHVSSSQRNPGRHTGCRGLVNVFIEIQARQQPA